MQLEDKIKKIKRILTKPRVVILKHLMGGESCVCEMVQDLSIKHNLLSYHLGVLNKEGFVSSKRNGRHIKYRINSKRQPCLNKVFDLVNLSDCH
jgi:ArsR family transcriptional regulator